MAQHVEECIRKVRSCGLKPLFFPEFSKLFHNAFGCSLVYFDQTSQSRSEEEDETVDVESYGDDTTNCVVNLASQNNNNVSKMDSVQSSPRSLSFSSEEHAITSRGNIWQHGKHSQHRIGSSPSSIGSNVNLVNSMPINCSTGGGIFAVSSESLATPTSSDQVTDYDHSNDDSSTIRCSTQSSMSNNNCDDDNDEEVIVDNTNDDDAPKKIMPLKDMKRSDKNR